MRIPPPSLGPLRDFLESLGFGFEARPYQAFLARNSGLVINAYLNGKIVVGGNNPRLEGQVREFIESLPGAPPARSMRATPAAASEFAGDRIGIDEAGKGDFFGPLVACAAFVRAEQVALLEEAGVKDSKKLSPTALQAVSRRVRNQILNRAQWTIVRISPWKYNQLHERMGNTNKILGWAHATALENLLTVFPSVPLAISDQFGDTHFIESQ